MKNPLAAFALLVCLPTAVAVAAAPSESNIVPNGSFEFWDRLGDFGLEHKKPFLWSEGAIVPKRWFLNTSAPSSLGKSSDRHGGRSALEIAAHRHALPVVLEMYHVEVIPSAKYNFGFWFKGNGKAVMTIFGNAVEGRQTIASVERAAGEQWSDVRGSFTAPKHIRTISVALCIPAEGQLLIDDLFVSTLTEQPFDADAVLSQKYGRDEHTLVFEDFDGELPSVISTCREVCVTGDGGGRFGKGLRLDRRGSASIPCGLGAMSQEGTLECWISMDGNEGLSYLSLMGDKSILSVGNWTWRISAGPDHPGYRDTLGLEGNQEIDVYRMYMGQWHHVAYTWDKTTVRLYIDGVLTDMKTSRELKWPGEVAFIQLSSTLERARRADGTIDEIRVSRVRRYGPVIPSGSAYVPPIRIPSGAEESASSARAPSSAKAGPASQWTADQRKRMIGTIPPSRPDVFEDKVNPDGNHVYEATSAKPLVKGGLCQIEADKTIKGLTVVRSRRGTGMLLPDHNPNEGLYWTLKNIPRARYWIGVTYSGNGATGTNASIAVYLNGRIVQLASQTDPVQLAPGAWFIEALARQAEELRPGDEIAVVFNHYDGSVVRVTLHSKAPGPVSECPWRTSTNFAGHQWNLYTALAVNAEGSFKSKDGKDAPHLQFSAIEQAAPSLEALRDGSGKVHLSAYVSNPLPVPVTVDYRCVVKSFYGDTAAKDVERLTVAPHDQIERKLSFDWKEGDLTYFADITLVGVNPPDLSASREGSGLGWPKHETLEFFPGHRQVLPWPDPFNARVVRRITIASPCGGPRQAHWLDGNDWEMAYTTDLEPPMPPPAHRKFERASIPRNWGWPNLNDIEPRPHGAYYRKTVELPGDLSGRSYKLIVEYAYDEATAYVNGKKVGNVRGDGTPIVCDITKALVPGRNEIMIVVRDIIAIMNPAFVNKDNPVGDPAYLDAPGLHGKDGLGIGSVRVESAPVVSTEDVFVATSVRQKSIAARITAASRGTASVDVTVCAEVLDDGQTVLRLGEKDLTLKPDQPVEFTLQKPWADPVLWGPGSPHLYCMRVTLTDAKSRKPLDVRRDRFGFRESWIDGPDIYLNGRPIKPVGYGPLVRLSPKGNFNFIRGGGRDWLDEAGIIGYKAITGIYNTPSQHNVENDRFWKTAEDNHIAALKMQQNSPHILAWDISNEWLCFFWGDPMHGARRFKRLSGVVRLYDPTRWTLANAEGDLHGLLDNASFHYMAPYFGGGNEFTMNGRTPYLPDAAFWRPLGRHLAAGEEITYCPLHPIKLRPDRKVLMDNEYLWKCGSNLMPPGPSTVVGEDDVVSPAVDSSSGPIAWMWKTFLDGHRDLGLSTTNVYSYHPGVQRGGFLEQAFIIPENQRHGLAGSRQTRRFTVVNSLFRPHQMALQWRLTGPDGEREEGQDISFTMNSGELRRGEFSFTLPNVDTKETSTLSVTLQSDGQFVCGEQWDIEVFPVKAPVAGPLARTVLLYDPKGLSASALEAIDVRFTRVASLSALSGAPADVLLIIGEDALDQYSAPTSAPLEGFVEAGGRVLALAQGAAPTNLPIETALEPRYWSSQVYVRAGSHPILQGLSSHDFHFWQPDRSVAVGAYQKPFSGSFITLLDACNWKTLDLVPMLEIFRGRGSYLLCQLPLASRHDVEPIARELLARTVRYCAGKSAYACPVKTLCVVTNPDSETAGVLANLKLKHRITDGTSILDAGSPVLLDADFARTASPDRKAGWAEMLNRGSTFVIVNAEPQDQQWISQLAGSKVSIGAVPFELWDGRGFRRGWSRYTAGLSHLDLYWKRHSGDEHAACQAEQTNNVIEPLQHCSAGAENARELVFPGALVELPAGQGTLLLDQRRWTAKDEGLARLAMRNVSSLMTALDVAMSSYIAPRPLPRELVSRTVDLSSLADWPLSHDSEAIPPGKKPILDLRGFPKEDGRFLNVPFALAKAPKTGVALASALDQSATALPEQVVIPVGYLAEGFHFLHTAAHSGDGPAANYKIVFADGNTCDLPVRGGVNVSDWNHIRRLPGADIAWTGSADEFPMIGVYRMLWVNHRPETPVKQIIFSNPEKKAFPVLIGVTAAVRRETVPVPPDVAARARKSLEDGKKAFRENKLDEAYRLLRDAVVSDPSLHEAYQALADAAEKKGNEDWMLDAYHLWTISGPRRPLPLNRMGELLEKRKEPRRALNCYKTSLTIEWNQPPIMEAVKRIEADLK